MSEDVKSLFLARLEELGAIAQNGLTFAEGAYDIDRYQQLRRLTAEMISDVSNLSFEQAKEWLSVSDRYATPNLDVRGLVMRGDQVLLVQEKTDQKWTLPGGWCDVNFSAGETAEKEVWEETGVKVKATRLLAFYDKHKHGHPAQIPHAHKCFFLCEEIGGAVLPETMETMAVAFFDYRDLPPLSLHRITAAQIETMVALARDPSAPTDFD